MEEEVRAGLFKAGKERREYDGAGVSIDKLSCEIFPSFIVWKVPKYRY